DFSPLDPALFGGLAAVRCCQGGRAGREAAGCPGWVPGLGARAGAWRWLGTRLRRLGQRRLWRAWLGWFEQGDGAAGPVFGRSRLLAAAVLCLGRPCAARSLGNFPQQAGRPHASALGRELLLSALVWLGRRLARAEGLTVPLVPLWRLGERPGWPLLVGMDGSDALRRCCLCCRCGRRAGRPGRCAMGGLASRPQRATGDPGDQVAAGAGWSGERLARAGVI
ncbi:hypothetical protein, partial [Thermogemmatispora sp.]|uniref:hypothetical protein n=1 Tax=Thermogemmatispora sp. TaxID=1968838 RepID=UPI002615D1DB